MKIIQPKESRLKNTQQDVVFHFRLQTYSLTFASVFLIAMRLRYLHEKTHAQTSGGRYTVLGSIDVVVVVVVEI